MNTDAPARTSLLPLRCFDAGYGAAMQCYLGLAGAKWRVDDNVM